MNFQIVDMRLMPKRPGAPFIFGTPGLRNIPLSIEGRNAIATDAEAAGFERSSSDWEALGNGYGTELFARTP